MKLKFKIVSILLLITFISFNLVLLPAQAEDGCRCDHSHGDGEFACFCGISSLKPRCDKDSVPTLTKRQCGLERHSENFFIPAHEYPSLISTETSLSNPHIALLHAGVSSPIYGIALPTLEHPPSFF